MFRYRRASRPASFYTISTPGGPAVDVSTVTVTLVTAGVSITPDRMDVRPAAVNVGALDDLTATFTGPARQGQALITGDSKTCATAARTVDACERVVDEGPAVVTLAMRI